MFTKRIVKLGVVFVLCCGFMFAQNKPTATTFSQNLTMLDSAETYGNTVTATNYKKGDDYFVYAGGDTGIIDVFKTSIKGDLKSVQQFELYNKKGPARGLVADRVAGQDYLFVGNKGGNAVEVLKIKNDGTLKRVFLLKDTEETYLETVITLKVIHMKSKSFLFVGGLERVPGLSCFEILKDGKLIHVQSIQDNDAIHTDGIIGMYSHKINGNTFLFTGGFHDNGISSFKVFENGAFENINNIKDNTFDRYLTGTYPVNGVTLGGNYYLIVGHRHHKYYKRIEFIKKKDFVYHGDGVSVFKINFKGEIAPHFVLKNNEGLKIGGQTKIEVLKVSDDNAIVAVGTRDDKSIQICNLDASGKLVAKGFFKTDFPIYYGLSSAQIKDKLLLYAGSVDGTVKKMFSYQINLAKDGDVVNTSKLRHVVALKYKETATEQEVQQAVEGFIDLQSKISEIEDIEWGENISKEGHSKGFTHNFIVTFSSEETRDAYLVHKEHLTFVSKIKHLISDVFVMDYWAK